MEHCRHSRSPSAALNGEDLTTLCFDHFRPVYEDFATGMSKGDKIQRLLDYCTRREQVEALLVRCRRLTRCSIGGSRVN